MHRISRPVEAFAIALGRVKRNTKFLDALLGTGETEDALDIGGYTFWSASATTRLGSHHIPFSFRKTPHLATTMGTYP
jgi:hypothetical protein